MTMDYDNIEGDPRPTYAPTQQYDQRRDFDVPRIAVPPPELDYDQGVASFTIAANDYKRLDDRCGNARFLRSIATSYPLRLQHSMLQWSYADRHQAQNILPFLLLGPSTVARQAEFIQSNGITYLLAVRSAVAISKHPKYLNPSGFPAAAGLETATFDLNTSYELITNIRPVIKKINDHLQASCSPYPITSVNDIRGRVMVFCETGNERSAVVVAAFLMLVWGVTAIEAIQALQSQRFCVSVDDDMKNMLQALEDIIMAEKGVAADQTYHSGSSPPSAAIGSRTASSKRSGKRGFEESDDEMDTDRGWDGEGRQRAGMAPFANIPG